MKGFKKSLPAALVARFVLSLLLFCVLVANVEAAVKYVTPGGAGTKDGSSWGNAYGNAEFITNLPLASSGDEFWLKAGTYKPTTSTTNRAATFQLLNGVVLYGGFSGTGSQRNPTVNLTVLSGDIDNNDSQTPVITNIATVTGNSTNSYHVVTGATGATLDGFTVTAAYSENAGYPDYFGGGMYNWNSSPMVANCTFSGNRTTAGGGMYNWNCSPTVTNCTFTGNQASTGAGMHNSASNPTVSYCTFSGNSFSTNGGGMYNGNSSSPIVMNCTFSGNSATPTGGGMFNSSSNTTVTNCTFSGNAATEGGAMYNSTSGSVTVTNCTFSGNSAVINGGGMYNNGPSPTVTNCTFSGNTASISCPGVYTTSGSPVLTNCILWDAATPEIDGGTPAVTYCVVRGGFTGTGNISVNPNLEPLASNGGFTQTHALPLGSSALDAGTGSGAPASDQRGMSRPQGSGIDIGSFEHSSAILYVTPGGAGTKNGASWATAYGNSEFISNLPLASVGTEFWLAAGVFKPTMNTADRNATFQLKDGVALYGGFAGDESNRDSRNPAANLTVLSGDIDNNDSQTPVITDLTTVTGNTLNSQHVVTGATGATLDGFTITAGYANESGYGGGIYIYYSSPTLVNCMISGNSARHTGGGMFNDHGSPTVSHCTFSGNAANYGGGMRNDFSNLTLTYCTFSGNSAYVYGGGMFNDSGNPTLASCTFSNNTAADNGGGMYSGGGSPVLVNCTFSGNTADLGGGMYNINGSPKLTNCTFSGNTAAVNGNGVFHMSGGSLTAANCIFWDASTPEIAGGTPTVTYCVVQGGFTGTGNISVDPGLGPLADNGGSTRTCALPVGSSALDAGTGTGAPGTDQRGVSRPQGIGLDIGAFELAAYQITFAAGTGGTLSGVTTQTVHRGGSSSPVSANALAGYYFVNWTGTGGFTSTANPLTVSNVIGTMAITANFALVIETVSAPTTPTGPATGAMSTSYDYATGDSISNLGHDVQYFFDWDDGSDSGWLAAGTTQGSHSWAANDTYHVRAMARCVTHTAIESLWSDTHAIIISSGGSGSHFNSPAQRLILPEVNWASASGGGDWVSEVQITDVTGGSVVQVYYNSGTNRRGPFTLWNNGGGAAGSSTSWSNMLQTIDGLDAGAFTYYGTGGSLEMITQDGSHRIQAAIRSTNGNYSRTFPALADVETNTAALGRTMMVPNMSMDTNFRPSLVLFNPGSDSVTADVKIIGSNGSQVGSTITRTVAGYEMAGVAGLRDNTYSNADFWVTVTGGSGRLLVSGQSANNVTNDPAAHVAVQAGPGYVNSPATRLIFPEVNWASASGGGDWAAELHITDMSGGAVVQVYYNSGTNRRGPFTLWTNGGGANRSVTFSNILQTIDGLDAGAFTYYGTGGALELVTQDNSHLIQAALKGYNGNVTRTFPAFQDVEANTTAVGRDLLIPNISMNTAYRPSVALFNTTADSVTVEVRIIGSDGGQIGPTITRTLAGFEMAGVAGLRDYTYSNAFIRITVTSGSGRVIASGQSANNTSNDPAAHIAVQAQ